MRFIIILIFLLSSLVIKSCPTDTTKYTLYQIPIESNSSFRPAKIAYIYKQEYGGYQVTFVLPDAYYWLRNPDMIIKLIDYDTGMVISSNILYDVNKGDCAFVKPGHYVMIVFVISHTHLSFFGDACYAIELSRTD